MEMQSEVTEVTVVRTGIIVGLTVRGGETTDAFSALQIDSEHKQTIYI